MFSAFKAFKDGWNSKGKHPSVSPSVARPFTDTAIAYLQDERKTQRVLEVICANAYGSPPFRFSYPILPFVVGSFWATTCYVREPEKFAFVSDALLFGLTQFFADKPNARFGDIIVDPSEINLAFIGLQTKGVTGIDREGMLRTEMEVSALAQLFFGLRSKQMRLIYEHVAQGDRSEKLLEAFAMKAGELFVRSVTPEVTEKKSAAAAFNILELVFRYSDGTKNAK